MNLRIQQTNAFLVNGRPVDVDFELGLGKLNLLVGENGAGKSTFFTHLKLNPSLLHSNKASFVDQPALSPLSQMRVEDALMLVFEEVPGATHWSEVEKKYRLGLGLLLDKSVSDLSGGENQKVKLAIALMAPFDILFADEPLQSLDERNQRLFLSVFHNLVDSGKTVLIIEHDIAKYRENSIGIVRLRTTESRAEIRND